MTERYPCADCERPMLSQPIYTSDATRWRAQGFVRHGAGDLCQACYLRYRRHGHAVPGMVPGHRRPAPGTGPLSDAEVARLRAMVGGDQRPCADAVRLVPAPPAPQPDEVFEIWDKVSQGRAIDLVFPTAVAAFAWLEPNVRPDRKGTGQPGDENAYRVQSVRMWRASEERAIPEPTEGQNRGE